MEIFSILLLASIPLILPLAMTVYLLSRRGKDDANEGNLFFDAKAMQIGFGVPGSISLLLLLLHGVDVIRLPEMVLILCVGILGFSVLVNTYMVPVARWRRMHRADQNDDDRNRKR